MTDPVVCSICGGPLDESRPWIPEMFEGTGAHVECLDTPEPEGDEEE